ncbi:hypothetical protein KY331_01440 [Candidatus Woesearchaeota archaeon]|nr:hypothetical protein [Candidatus Woesearchaeota archaeon]
MDDARRVRLQTNFNDDTIRFQEYAANRTTWIKVQEIFWKAVIKIGEFLHIIRDGEYWYQGFIKINGRYLISYKRYGRVYYE